MTFPVASSDRVSCASTTPRSEARRQADDAGVPVAFASMLLCPGEAQNHLILRPQIEGLVERAVLDG